MKQFAKSIKKSLMAFVYRVLGRILKGKVQYRVEECIETLKQAGYEFKTLWGGGNRASSIRKHTP